MRGVEEGGLGLTCRWVWNLRDRLENGINVLLPVPGLYLRPVYRKDSDSKAGGADGREWWVIPSHYTWRARSRLHKQSNHLKRGHHAQ